MFLDILNKLKLEKNLNNRKLSIASGIPYTTIDGLYKKGYDNVKLSTLIKLASYFDVTLDYLINGDETILNSREKDLIIAYRSKPEMQLAVDKLLGLESDALTNDVINTVNSIGKKTPTKQK